MIPQTAQMFQAVRALGGDPTNLKIPDINPLNPKYRLFIEAWKRLPLPIANTLGPLIARDLG